MNKLALALFLGSSLAKTQLADNQKMVEIVKGFLKGAIEAEGFNDIETCITDVEHVVSDAETAFTDFESKDVHKIVDGFKQLVDLMRTVKSGMQDCSSLKADWQKLEDMAAVFSSPSSFAWHVGKDLLVNGVQIYQEIDTAVQDYKVQNWNDFGYNLGEASAKVLLGQESKLMISESKKDKVAKVMQGILEEFGGSFDLYALLICIYDEDQAALMLDIGIQSFAQAWNERKTDPQSAIGDAIGGIIGLIGAVQLFQQGLPACEAIDTKTFNYGQFQQCIDIAIHPTEHFEILEKDLLINGVSIMKDIELSLQAYQSGDFKLYGNYMGKILKLSTNQKKQKFIKKQNLPSDNRTAIAEIAQGLLEATKVGEFNFTNLLLCIYEADQAALILYEAVDILEQAYKDKDATEVVGAVIALLAFAQQLQQSIPVCESVDSKSLNWTEFNKIVEVAEHPTRHINSIGKDIIMNGKTITQDVSEAIQAYRSGDFKFFGQKIGQTLILATQDSVPENLFLY